MTSRYLTSLFAAAALTVGIAHAQGGPNCTETYPCLPDGTPLTCQVQPDGTKVWVDADGNTYGSDTQGSGTFQVSQCLPADCTTELKPTDIQITSDAGRLGVITTTLDASRAATVSSLVSLNAGSFLPASEDFYFYANAEISSRPGKKYRSVQELHFNSKEVRTFNPHKQERFHLVGKVDFEDVDAPDEIAFTLENADITLN